MLQLRGFISVFIYAPSTLQDLIRIFLPFWKIFNVSKNFVNHFFFFFSNLSNENRCWISHHNSPSVSRTSGHGFQDAVGLFHPAYDAKSPFIFVILFNFNLVTSSFFLFNLLSSLCGHEPSVNNIQTKVSERISIRNLITEGLAPVEL